MGTTSEEISSHELPFHRRTVVRKALTNVSEMELQGFVQRLALHLTTWQATTFLIGEYVEGELRDNPVFTVADGLFWLYQRVLS